MFGLLLQCIEYQTRVWCGAPTFVVVPNEVGNHRFAFGDGASLIQYDGVYFVRQFEAFSVLDEDIVFRAFTYTHHDGGWGGQAKGTGTGYDAVPLRR